MEGSRERIWGGGGGGGGGGGAHRPRQQQHAHLCKVTFSLSFLREARWPNGQCTGFWTSCLSSRWGHCIVFLDKTLVSQCLSPPRCINFKLTNQFEPTRLTCTPSTDNSFLLTLKMTSARVVKCIISPTTAVLFRTSHSLIQTNSHYTNSMVILDILICCMLLSQH